jgi:carbon-monoxide dehydrogenase large subunit
VVTNKTPGGTYRSPGRFEINFVRERLIDIAAHSLGMDPVDIRRRNLISEFPHTSASGVVQDAGSYREAMEAAAKLVDMAVFRARQKLVRAEGIYLGLGVSVFSERTGPGSPAFTARRMALVPGFERVELAMDPSGFLEARIGSSPHGQGLKTSLAQLLADETGVAPSQIRVISGDTDRTPYGWGTFASRSLVIAGGACKLAGALLGERSKSVAAQMLEAAASDIESPTAAQSCAAPISASASASWRGPRITRAICFRRSPRPGCRRWRL